MFHLHAREGDTYQSGDSTRVHSSASLCGRNPLDSVHPTLPSESLISTLPFNFQDDIFQATSVDLVRVHDSGVPLPVVREAHVHPKEVRDEQ